MILQSIAIVIFILYASCLVFILLFCLMQLHLLYHYLTARKKQFRSAPPRTSKVFWPAVTVQLPIYNEVHVVERLIHTCCQLDYPGDKLQIQVLDDSTDRTKDIAAEITRQYRNAGINITQITRSHRAGFKAGALQEGLTQATGEFIAIFDADFLPPREFLKTVIPAFARENIAVVQTRWAYLNEDYSILTQLQALQLNLHFSIEQSGRQAGALFLQFNGTGGIWRKEAIHDAGGWHSDTLTEDLDLSYRAQLQGWKIRYLEDVGTPSELPAFMPGIKSQQYRWMKGGAETARKMLPKIWSASLPLFKKLHASLHLLSSSVFLSVFLLGVLSVPLSLLSPYVGISMQVLNYALIITFAVALMYYAGNVIVPWNRIPARSKVFYFMYKFPMFLCMSMGLSLHNSRAVWLGFLGKRTAFVRTPKFNLLKAGDKISDSSYLRNSLTPVTVIEGLLCLYFLFAILISSYLGNFRFMLFHLMLMLGYGAIFYFSVRDENGR